MNGFPKAIESRRDEIIIDEWISKGHRIPKG
jgi:hypothetical protein